MWSNTYMPYARVPSDPSPVSRKSYVGETTSVTSVTPVKHSDNFKIVILLDESGSMEDVAENMLSSLNGLIKEQKQVKSRPCNLTLLKFHNSVKTVIDNCDLREIQLLKKSDYSPGGTTALYDALGYAMERFRYERDVLLVVLTDGQENASRQYNGKLPQLLKQIKERETHCGWSYVYLGCDLNTLSQGTSLGFNTSRTSTNCAVAKGRYTEFVTDLSEAVTNCRTKGMSVQTQLNNKYAGSVE